MLLNLRRSPAEQNWDEIEQVLNGPRNSIPMKARSIAQAEMLLDRGKADQPRTDQAAPRKFAGRA